MKMTIELDPSCEADVAAMRRLFGATAEVVTLLPEARLVVGDSFAREQPTEVLFTASDFGPPPAPKAAAKPKAKPKAKRKAKATRKVPVKVAKAAKAIAERGKAMTKAAQDLGSVVGPDRAKLTPSEKAKVAAKARWATHPKAPGPQAAKQAREATKPKDPSLRSAPVKKPAPRPEPKPHDYGRAEEQPISQFAESPGGDVRLPGGDELPLPYPDGRELLEGTFKVPPEPPKEEDDHEGAIAEIARELGGLPEPEGAVAEGGELPSV